MRRMVVQNGVCMLAESRDTERRTPLFPVVPSRRRVACLIAFIIGTAMFNVWLSGQYYRIGYAVSASIEERRALQQQRDLLRTEILSLSSPSRIEYIAKAELGMIDPRTDRMLQVK